MLRVSSNELNEMKRALPTSAGRLPAGSPPWSIFHSADFSRLMPIGWELMMWKSRGMMITTVVDSARHRDSEVCVFVRVRER